MASRRKKPNPAANTAQADFWACPFARPMPPESEPPAEHRPPSPTFQREPGAQGRASAPRRGEHGEQSEPRGGLPGPSTRLPTATDGGRAPHRATSPTLGRLQRRPAVSSARGDLRRNGAHRELALALRERRDAQAYRERWQYQDGPATSPLGKLQDTPDHERPPTSDGANPSELLKSPVWKARTRMGLGELPPAVIEGQEVAWQALRARARPRLDDSELTVRQRAWALRDAGRAVHPSHRCASCGWSRIGEVGVVDKGDGLGFALASVATCSSVWTCAACALVIKGRRAEEIKAGVELHRQHFGARSMLLVTYTVRHQAGQDLEQIARGFQRAWNRFKTRVPTRTKLARKLEPRVPSPAEAVGTIGGVYCAEVTHGANGWHYHRHELVALDRNVTADEIEAYEREQAIWWAECVAHEMGPEHVPSLEHGLDARPLHLADYISKLGLELSDVGAKHAQDGNTTPWGLLASSARGSQLEFEWFTEYALAMRAKKCLQFSTRLLERWQALGWKHEPEDIADESQGARLVLEVPAEAWAAVRRTASVVDVLSLPTITEVEAALRAIAGPLWQGPTRWGDGARVAFEVDRVTDRAEQYAVQLEGGGTRRPSSEEKRARARRERAAMRREVDRENERTEPHPHKPDLSWFGFAADRDPSDFEPVDHGL